MKNSKCHYFIIPAGLVFLLFGCKINVNSNQERIPDLKEFDFKIWKRDFYKKIKTEYTALDKKDKEYFGVSYENMIIALDLINEVEFRQKIDSAFQKLGKASPNFEYCLAEYYKTGETNEVVYAFLKINGNKCEGITQTWDGAWKSIRNCHSFLSKLYNLKTITGEFPRIWADYLVITFIQSNKMEIQFVLSPTLDQRILLESLFP